MLSFVAAACGGGDNEATLTPAPDREPPSLVTPATTTTAAPAIVQTPAGPGTTAAPPTTAPAPTSPAPPQQPAGPRPLSPAPPGAYRFDTIGQSTLTFLGPVTTPFPAVTTMIARPPAGTAQAITRDLRDPAGAGPVTESSFDFRNDGVYLVGLKLTVIVAGVTQSELRPPSPLLILPTGAVPGFHKEMDIPTATGTARLAFDLVRNERLTIGGQVVDTAVVRLLTSLGGQLNARLDYTVWVTAGSGLFAKERFIVDAGGQGQLFTYHSQYDATLQRLTPT